jgi:biofilm PGA synthesis N-glycosyltransferase PgaC
MPIAFLYILASANLICMIHIGLYSVGANSYDIIRFKKDHDLLKRQPDLPARPPRLKSVSVVIPAHNEARVIRRTLDSVLANNYPKIEIIVVNDGSTDKTAEIVKAYIKRVKKSKHLRVWSYFNAKGYAGSHKLRYIRIHRSECHVKLVTQKNQGKATAMNNAIKNHVKGQFIMCLDADSILHPQAIEKALSYFKSENVVGVAANVRVIESPSLLGRVQRFEHMIGYRSKKFYSMTNSEFIIGGVASTYRKSIMKRVEFYDDDTMTEDIGLSLKIVSRVGNRKHRIVYASDVVALTEGVGSLSDLMKQRYRWKMGNLQNLYKYRHLIGRYKPAKYSRMLTLYRLPMALLSEVLLVIEPLLIAYIIYLSVQYHTLGIVIGAYLTITLYTMSVLWPDEHLTTTNKLKLSLSAIWIYGLFYIMDVVQLFAMFRTLRLYKFIIHRERSSSTWISPRRAGQNLLDDKPSFDTAIVLSDNSPADSIFKRLWTIFKAKPNIKDKVTEVDATTKLSKHQKFIKELSSSGKDLATIQTAWHQYYVDLTDKEKYEVWQEFYAANQNSSYQLALKTQQTQVTVIRSQAPTNDTEISGMPGDLLIPSPTI